MTPTDQYPSYADLRERTDKPAGSSWGVFGDDDEIGTLNFITPETVQRTAQAVRRGATFNFDVPLNSVMPWPVGGRPPAEHHITKNAAPECDDWIDSFYLQQSTQIDGLRHRGHPVHGFYNGVPIDQIEAGTPRLGIQHWAERGIVGRGLLIDVGRTCTDDGIGYPVDSSAGITVEMLEETIKAQGSPVEAGDIILLRTGWLGKYRLLDADARATLALNFAGPGLAQSYEMVEWLWDHRISMVAADNPALEAFPPVPGAPFPWSPALLHPILIPLLGLALGELWDLDALAADSAADSVYSSMVVAKPLNLVGGVGSTANALALK